MSIEKIIAAIPEKSEADRKKMRVNAERWLASGTESQKEQASRFLDALDEQGAVEDKERHETLSAMPLSERVVEAFQTRPATPTEEKAIRALLARPGSTATELSRACGWKGQIWHTRFATMCKNREADLWPVEPAATRDAHYYSGILAEFDPEVSRFTMKPDVAVALVELGIGEPADA